MPLTLPKELECSGIGGADPLVRAGRPVPLPEQRYQHLAGCERADEGVGCGPGGPPHRQGRPCGIGKVSGIGFQPASTFRRPLAGVMLCHQAQCLLFPQEDALRKRVGAFGKIVRGPVDGFGHPS